MMILGLPFPTYLGWFVGPILTLPLRLTAFTGM